MMTNEEKFKKGIVVYKTKDDTVCELWNASTKHPDSIFYFSDFKKTPFVDEEHQVFQWLLECASKLTFPMHAKELVEYALKNYVTWEKAQFSLGFFVWRRAHVPCAPNLPLYHIPTNLSREKLYKDRSGIFPKFVQHYLLHFSQEYAIL